MKVQQLKMADSATACHLSKAFGVRPMLARSFNEHVHENDEHTNQSIKSFDYD